MIFNVVLISLFCTLMPIYAELDELYVWKYIDYVWDNPTQKSVAINSGEYNYTANIPYDVDRALDGRVFVTVVKDVGVPATLSTVSRRSGNGGPLLRPYPDWSWHRNMDCNGIIGVYRIAIRCNHMWVLDCGKIGNKQVCPAKLLLFNLWNDELVQKIIIPNKYAANASGSGLLVTPVVDSFHDGCKGIKKSHVYMADTEGYGMVIWDGDHLARIESEYFLPEADATVFNIADETFSLSDGLLGMAIDYGQSNRRERRLYFRSLASFNMSYAKVKELDSLKFTPSNIRYHSKSYRLSSQSVAQAFSRRGILFYSSVSNESMICWNHRKPFDEDNNVQFATNKETLQFASGVKVIDDGTAEYLYVMTNRYQQVVNNKIDFTDNNFRVLIGNVDDIVDDTNCE